MIDYEKLWEDMKQDVRKVMYADAALVGLDYCRENETMLCKNVLEYMEYAENA